MTRTAAPRRWLVSLCAWSALLALAVTASSPSACEVRSAAKPASAAKHVRAARAARVAAPAVARAPVAVRPAPAPAPAVAPVPALAPAVTGMRAFLDPESGTIGGMPPGGPAALAGAAPVDPLQDLVEVRLPDGSYMVDLKGRFAEYAVMKLDVTGRMHMLCGPDAGALMLAPPPAPRAEEK